MNTFVIINIANQKLLTTGMCGRILLDNTNIAIFGTSNKGISYDPKTNKLRDDGEKYGFELANEDTFYDFNKGYYFGDRTFLIGDNHVHIFEANEYMYCYSH